LDTSEIRNMENMFQFCSELKTIPLLDTGNVYSMSWMFDGCERLETVPNLNTENVHQMFNIFKNCRALKTLNMEDYSLYDFSELDNPFLKEKYPEYFI